MLVILVNDMAFNYEKRAAKISASSHIIVAYRFFISHITNANDTINLMAEKVGE